MNAKCAEWITYNHHLNTDDISESFQDNYLVISNLYLTENIILCVVYMDHNNLMHVLDSHHTPNQQKSQKICR